MDLYDGNYRLIRMLIPDLDRMPDCSVSRVDGSPDLYLKIVERCKYTTIISLSYIFETDDGECIADPNLIIRLYHDARQVEAMSCRNSGFMPANKKRFGDTPALNCKWESNLFLEKWLDYSLQQGHRFEPGSRFIINEEKSSVLEAL
jgi:uncharacterized protein YqiB (DUF1249 family)